jgi:hypothetical protein
MAGEGRGEGVFIRFTDLTPLIFKRERVGLRVNRKLLPLSVPVVILPGT